MSSAAFARSPTGRASGSGGHARAWCARRGCRPTGASLTGRRHHALDRATPLLGPLRAPRLRSTVARSCSRWRLAIAATTRQTPSRASACTMASRSSARHSVACRPLGGRGLRASGARCGPLWARERIARRRASSRRSHRHLCGRNRRRSSWTSCASDRSRPSCTSCRWHLRPTPGRPSVTRVSRSWPASRPAASCTSPTATPGPTTACASGSVAPSTPGGASGQCWRMARVCAWRRRRTKPRARSVWRSHLMAAPARLAPSFAYRIACGRARRL